MKYLILIVLLLIAGSASADLLEHNTQDTADISDVSLNGRTGGTPTYQSRSYGETEALSLGDYYTSPDIPYTTLVSFPNLWTEMDDSSVTSADYGYLVLTLSQNGVVADDTLIVKVYNVLVPWEEGRGDDSYDCGTSFDSSVQHANCFGAPGTKAVWTTEGCASSGNDYSATLEDSIMFVAAHGYVPGDTIMFYVSGTTIETWETTNYGLVLHYENINQTGLANYLSFYSVEYWDSGQYEPYFLVYYNTAAAATGQVMKVNFGG